MSDDDRFTLHRGDWVLTKLGDGVENDLFLKATQVTNEEQAIRNSIQAALQRNTTYKRPYGDSEKTALHIDLKKQLHKEAEQYTSPASEAEHCEAIRRIATTVSGTCENFLVGGRFRYGTAQKAFNLYLKFLWRLEKIPTPPHCPVDRVVLRRAGIEGSWTKCDSEDEYLGWIKRIKFWAGPLGLAEWEYTVWLQDYGY